jgi:hypothetical protein
MLKRMAKAGVKLVSIVAPDVPALILTDRQRVVQASYMRFRLLRCFPRVTGYMFGTLSCHVRPNKPNLSKPTKPDQT